MNAPPAWMPSALQGATVLPAGVHWDAVRLPLGRGMPVVDVLPTTPVIRNQATMPAGSLAWLIPVGSADTWPDLRQVDVLRGTRAGRRLTVPAATEVWTRWDGGPATSWRIPPRGQPLADPAALLAALDRVLGGALR
ncbi:hypothetical protein FH609_011775 [Streptomyces sp. 3MP-14]|uniref:Uncharacterized protein n=1 Tax=Streptomyces mimosae TaxID=2586635 RepID=A0A5N6AG83_9ACTN|nr:MULTISPECIES: hypothetical protein [Streptomyces]KAB8167073.1 hypothetical protein FH607_009225 [Streptomyces mimosae]KAB8177014.1 hypothetical protein FH609_011775 [Streptomyces sp. 3MP-14]